MNGGKAAGLHPTGMSGRIEMRTPDGVSAMLAPKSCGRGTKRSAAEPGCSRNRVKRWIAAGGWHEMAPVSRRKSLDGLEDWIAERFRQHAGNADVMRQELAAAKGAVLSLRTVERAVGPLRQELRAEARATVRFETRPGQQLQIDFGERRVWIGAAQETVFFFVAPLGHSRRLHVRTFRAKRQEHRFAGMESAFRTFGGVPEEGLLDNARALIQHPDPVSREVVVNPELHAVARHRGFRVKACAPCRARTRGKDGRGVGYVKSDAIAGRRFARVAALEAHLEAWTREVADVRAHGTTGEAPRLRFERDEAHRLRPAAGVPPFMASRDLMRKVTADRSVEVDGSACSVPWRLIGERVTVTVTGAELRVLQAGQVVARHALRAGRHGRVSDPAHFAGIGRRRTPAILEGPPALLRPLAGYDAVAGGAW